jgi:large subunit ribosomal protein L22
MAAKQVREKSDSEFVAKALYIRWSPFKMRPLADVIRGKNAQYALNWLTTCKLKRADSLKKVVESAAANAKHLKNVDAKNLKIKEIRVDQGPTQRYYKPGAMGRAGTQKRRFSHLSIVLESIEAKEA